MATVSARPGVLNRPEALRFLLPGTASGSLVFRWLFRRKPMIATLLTLVIYILIIGLIFWLIHWIIGFVRIPEPFATVARVILGVVALIIVILLLLQLVGAGPSLPKLGMLVPMGIFA